MKTLVIGLGNPILGDDGVGWRVAEEVAKLTADRPEIEVDCFSLGGLSLMERLTGYENVIIIDAFLTTSNHAGNVNLFPLIDLPDLSSGHTTAAHDTSLRNALKVGRGLDVPLPKDEDIFVIAIEAENVYDFSQELSTAVASAVPRAVKAVLSLLNIQNEGE